MQGGCQQSLFVRRRPWRYLLELSVQHNGRNFSARELVCTLHRDGLRLRKRSCATRSDSKRFCLRFSGGQKCHLLRRVPRKADRNRLKLASHPAWSASRTTNELLWI